MNVQLDEAQADMLYQMRLEQYEWEEKRALGRMESGEHVNAPEGYVDHAEWIHTKYEKARAELKDDIKNSPLSIIARAYEDGVSMLEREWTERRAAHDEKYREIERRLAAVPVTSQHAEVINRLKMRAVGEGREIDKWLTTRKDRVEEKLEGLAYWDGEVGFHQNPMSSWSIDHDTAMDFALMRAEGDSVAVTMWSEVPAERIISIPFTGPGCLTEHEFLVAGGKMPVHYRCAAYDKGETGRYGPKGRKRFLDPYVNLAADTRNTVQADIQNTHASIEQLVHQKKMTPALANSYQESLLSGDPDLVERIMNVVKEIAAK